MNARAHVIVFMVLVVSSIVTPPRLIKADENGTKKVMTPAEALAHALKNSTIVLAAKGSTAVFEAKLKAAQALAWPHIEGTLLAAPKPKEYGEPGKGETDFSTWGVLARAEVSGYLPLYTFEKISRLKEAAALGVDVGHAQQGIAAAETRFLVLKAVYGLSLAREMVDVISEGRSYLEKARQHLDELSRSDDESFDPVDTLRLKVYEAQVLAKELEAKRAAEYAEAALRTVIGMNPDDDVTFDVGQPTPVEVELPGSLDELVFAAIEERPEMIALRKGVAAKKALVDAKRAAYWPDIVAVGMARYTYSNVSNRTGMDDPYNGYAAGAGLALRFDLDISKKTAELRETEAELAKLEAEALGAERGIRLEVTKIYREVKDSQKMLKAYEEARDAARGWVIAKTDLYENGLCSMEDVLTALAAFFQARLDHLKSIYDYDTAVASLERATGLRLIPVP